MAWYVYLVHFVAALFLTNSIPHLVNGISGRKFPSPFARPPGRGESSAPVNVAWAGINILIGGLLLWFWPLAMPLQAADVIVFAVGAFVTAFGLANGFSRPRMG